MSAEKDREVPPPPYVLLELEDVTPVLQQPLTSSSRIKYTCFDVSRSLIVLGATSGGVYVFSRTPLEFMQLIPNKDGVLTRLVISSDEKYISFANGKGLVTVVECSQKVGGSAPSSLVSREHQGNEVTAMMWSWSPMILYIGDDVGKVSILQIPTFITKTMFHSTTQVIMNLDSRVCQIDIEQCMLVVSTLTRCYISDTTKERYRQIGQKLRDGEYGICFLTCTDYKEHTAPQLSKLRSQSFAEQPEVNRYNVMAVDDDFAISDKLANTLIYCGRPSSRLWEASVDGTVQRTHQFKQVLARPPSQAVTQMSYQNENITINANATDTEAQSLNFAKLYALKNCVVFTYKKDAIYFLNTENVEHTTWFDRYKDIVDCRIYQNTLFLWHQNGTMTSLLFLRVDKYLIKCFVEEKYVLCGELCALYCEYLMSAVNLCPKIHIVTGLKDKLGTVNSELLDRINPVLDKLASLKTKEATQTKSGIYIVDNKHSAQSSFHDDNAMQRGEADDDVNFLPPEAMQALKDLSCTVTDRFSSSKKKLKEKWDDLEEKVKNIGVEKHYPHDVRQANEGHLLVTTNPQAQERHLLVAEEKNERAEQNDIIYKESSQSIGELDNKSKNDKVEKLFKSLYQQYRLTLVKESESNNLCHIVDGISCDINEIYQILVQFEEYCKSIDISEEESKFISNTIFLTYINTSERRDPLLNSIIEDAALYQTFVDACVTVNIKTHKKAKLACECGYPLPYANASQTPAFSDLIDRFVEKQWSSHTQAQCYEICKKMPHLWRKILYLRRNEDLLNILLLLLQMLDESLLHSFLPQFTMTTWDRTIQLFSILYTNVCLNCRTRFESVNVKEMLSWDTLGLLLIKSVGGADAVNVMRRHGDLLHIGDLTLKFYHTCLLVASYEKYDGLIRNQLTDTLYRAYEFEDSRIEICKLLKSILKSDVRNTSLPLIVAAKSPHWGLTVGPSTKNPKLEVPNELEDKFLLSTPECSSTSLPQTNLSLKEVLENFENVNNGVSDCILCGLPLVNEVLIKDGGLWVFRCGHSFHGVCLDLLKVKLCPSCTTQAHEALLSVPKEFIL